MATLTSQITETLTLNGTAQGGTNTFTITGINESFKHIVACLLIETNYLLQ